MPYCKVKKRSTTSHVFSPQQKKRVAPVAASLSIPSTVLAPPEQSSNSADSYGWDPPNNIFRIRRKVPSWCFSEHVKKATCSDPPIHHGILICKLKMPKGLGAVPTYWLLVTSCFFIFSWPQKKAKPKTHPTRQGEWKYRKIQQIQVIQKRFLFDSFWILTEFWNRKYVRFLPACNVKVKGHVRKFCTILVYLHELYYYMTHDL